MSMSEPHQIRAATEEEKKIDCCGERHECNVDYVCSCNEMLCSSCMNAHVFKIHYVNEQDDD